APVRTLAGEQRDYGRRSLVTLPECRLREERWSLLKRGITTTYCAEFIGWRLPIAAVRRRDRVRILGGTRAAALITSSNFRDWEKGKIEADSPQSVGPANPSL